MPLSHERFEVEHYLGNMIGKKDPYLKAIACMSKDWREIRSYLELLFILDKLKKTKLTKEQKNKLKIICEAVERLGQAPFQMDVVSHLAMKIGESYKKRSW